MQALRGRVVRHGTPGLRTTAESHGWQGDLHHRRWQRSAQLSKAKDKNEDPLIPSLNLKPPELFTVPSSDGRVVLQGAFYKPDASKFGPGPYPTVVSCYGGPHVQFISDNWGMTADLRAQAMRSKGFLVVKCDNRGSNRATAKRL